MCRWWEEGRSREETLAWLARAFPHAPIAWLEQISAACAGAAALESEDLMCVPQLLRRRLSLKVMEHVLYPRLGALMMCAHAHACVHTYLTLISQLALLGGALVIVEAWHVLAIFPLQVLHPVIAPIYCLPANKERSWCGSCRGVRRGKQVAKDLAQLHVWCSLASERATLGSDHSLRCRHLPVCRAHT